MKAYDIYFSIEEEQFTTMQEIIKDIIEWDIRNWSKSLDFWLNKSNLDLLNSNALEIGSRNGGLTLWLAKQGCKVTCSDLNGPSVEARQKHKKHRIDHLVQYSNIDATTIPFENGAFDIVVFKSVLGGIGCKNNKEAQSHAIQEIYRVLKPGGELFFAENLIASPFHSFLRRHFTSWGQNWRYPSIYEMEEFLSPFSKTDFFCTGFLAAFGRTEKQREILAMIDDACLNKIISNRWRYILIGLAKK